MSKDMTIKEYRKALERNKMYEKYVGHIACLLDDGRTIEISTWVLPVKATYRDTIAYLIEARDVRQAIKDERRKQDEDNSGDRTE
jgi:hypothetical protein